MTRGGPDRIRLTRDLDLEVLYEDKSLLAVNKPPGWLVAPSAWDRTRRNLMLTLQTGIDRRAHWAVKRGLRFLKNIHRLDAETTGVLLLGKSRIAVAKCSALFRSRAVRKIYFAVADGVSDRDSFDISLPLSPSPERQGLMSVDKRHGKASRTHVEVVHCQRGRSFLKIIPDTGRTHQIRVHLAAVGLPIVGDQLYGKGHKSDRLLLHASELNFVHPFSNEKTTITAPFPSDFPEPEFSPNVAGGHRTCSLSRRDPNRFQ